MSRIVRVGFIGLLILCIIFMPAAPGLSVEPDDEGDLEAFLDGVMVNQMDEHNIPGAALSVVKNGEVLISKGYGLANLQERRPVDSDTTLFRPGSVSKLISWTAVMQLVEQGKLDLEADVNTYLDFEIPNHLLHNRGSEPGPITLEHLLTHTPGFEDVGDGLFVLSPEDMVTLEEYLRTHLPARVFPPGELIAYSNYGSALAGYIVEKVSGQPFEEYVEENIFDLLDMDSSTFRQPLPEHLLPYMSRAYKYAGGEYHEGGFEYISALPAGSMSTTASDMANFMIAHLQDGLYGEEQILQKETAREMHSQQFTHHPKIDGMTYGFIEDTFNGERVITHGGATMLFYSGLYLLPEHDLGLFVSYSGGDGVGGQRLFQAFMDRYYPDSYIPSPEPPKDAHERAAAYLGEYHPNRSNFTTFEKLLGIMQSARVDIHEEGYLIVNFYGEDLQFVEVEPGVYQNRHPDDTQLVKTLVFENDPEGRPLLAAGPMTYTKAPWYGSSFLLSGLTAAAFLLMLGTLLGWLIGFSLRFFRREKRIIPLGAAGARLVAVLFSLLVVVFLLGLMAVVSNIDPAYGVPKFFFGLVTPVMSVILSLPLLMAFFGAAMVVFTLLAWRKGYWTFGGRLHYTVLTITALGFMWVMVYSNLL